MGIAFSLAGDVPEHWPAALADLADAADTADPTDRGDRTRAGTARFAVAAAGAGRWTLSVDGAPVAEGDADALLDRLVVEVRARVVAARTHVVLHAAAVGRGGTVILMPGASGTGKSSTAVDLVRRGWSYWGDELIAVGATGALVACPTPPRLTATDAGGPGGDGGKRFVPLRTLVDPPPRTRAQADVRVVLLRRGAPGLAPIARGSVLAALGASAFPVADEGAAFGRLAALARRARCWTCSAGSATEAAALLDGAV